MDFEKWLHKELKQSAESSYPSEKIKRRITTSIKPKNKTLLNTKRIVAILLFVIVLIPMGTIMGTNAKTTIAPSLVIQDMFGTLEEAKRKWNISAEGYEERMRELEVAEKYLTDDELTNYIHLRIQQLELYKKMVTYKPYKSYDLHLLTGEEKANFIGIQVILDTYIEKYMAYFDYSKEQAEEIMGYKVYKPIYIPDGYSFVDEEIEPEITINNPKPIISTEYSSGSYAFTIYQSEQIDGKRDPWWDFENVEIYKLDGHTMCYGTDSDSNIKGLKMTIDKEDDTPARQIVVIDSNLSKSELERIITSIINQEKNNK